MNTPPQAKPECEMHEQRTRRGKILGGILLVTIGGLLLAREFGADIPWWIFTWKMLLIGIGIVSGIKHGFTKLFWLVPLGVGLAFLINDHFYPGIINTHMIWPVVLIVIGIVFIFNPKRKWGAAAEHKWQKKSGGSHGFTLPAEGELLQVTGDGNLEITAFMSGVEKVVMSKDFRKGEINAFMGGAQVDMSQSDMHSTASLEVNAVMGGVKLIIPGHWEVVSEINCILGGVEDKRRLTPPQDAALRKTLILEGNAVMGGIEIRNY